ncbi:hypothetical protein NH399_08865 [Pleionea sp. CnH1-48]|nr:hypothetical protein [Pleionea sp. CnH1-48]
MRRHFQIIQKLEKDNASLQKKQSQQSSSSLAITDDRTKVILQDNSGCPVWSTPFKVAGRINRAQLTESRVIITSFSLDYHAWGTLGPVYLLNKEDGALIKELKGETAATLANGDFLLGLEGYDLFDTWLYDCDGNQKQQWKSYGHYVVDKNDIIVLEADRRNPTQAHVVRLKSDGSIEKGVDLHCGSVSEPIVLKDRSIAFIDSGNFRVVNRELEEIAIEPLIAIDKDNAYRFISDLYFESNQIRINIYERENKSPYNYKLHSWLVQWAK